MGKRSVRGITKSAVVALLLFGSSQISGPSPAQGVRLHQIGTDSIETAAAGLDPTPVNMVNPEFVSSMTLPKWKLFSNDETLDMYQKAEYQVKKNENEIKNNVVDEQKAQNNLEEAKKNLQDADNTIVKLQTELQELIKNKSAAEERK